MMWQLLLRYSYYQKKATTPELSARRLQQTHVFINDCFSLPLQKNFRGSKVLLFVREFKSDRMTGGAEAYTYLGTASYVKHTGSRPMNITWKLDRPIPAKFLKKTNKLAVG